MGKTFGWLALQGLGDTGDYDTKRLFGEIGMCGIKTGHHIWRHQCVTIHPETHNEAQFE